MGEDWHIDKGIDLSLILTVIGCASAVLIATVKGWLHFHDRTKDLEAGQDQVRVEIATIKDINHRELVVMRELHERDRESLSKAFADFTTRIESAINRLYDKLDAKADKAQ